MKWGEIEKDYTMNSVSYKIMDYLYELSRLNMTKRLNGNINGCLSSKSTFRDKFDITEPTFRKVMADLTERGYIRYIENRNHFVEVEILI